MELSKDSSKFVKGLMCVALLLLLSFAVVVVFTACVEDPRSTSDRIQGEQQEKILQEGTAAIGMPNIKNFREKRLLKDILELRDQKGLITYTYLWNEFNGKKVFFCNSVGYGIPYATQFTNPEKPFRSDNAAFGYSLPQADPNGLFSPDAAEGTWIMCRDPNGDEAKPIYVEPRVIVSPFKLPE
jgi:hypothetical protein